MRRRNADHYQDPAPVVVSFCLTMQEGDEQEGAAAQYQHQYQYLFRFKLRLMSFRCEHCRSPLARIPLAPRSLRCSNTGRPSPTRPLHARAFNLQSGTAKTQEKQFRALISPLPHETGARTSAERHSPQGTRGWRGNAATPNQPLQDDLPAPKTKATQHIPACLRERNSSAQAGVGTVEM